MAKGLGDVWLANVQLYTNQRKKHPTKCPVFTVEFFFKRYFCTYSLHVPLLFTIGLGQVVYKVKSSLINDTYTRTAAKELQLYFILEYYCQHLVELQPDVRWDFSPVSEFQLKMCKLKSMTVVEAVGVRTLRRTLDVPVQILSRGSRRSSHTDNPALHFQLKSGQRFTMNHQMLDAYFRTRVLLRLHGTLSLCPVLLPLCSVYLWRALLPLPLPLSPHPHPPPACPHLFF